MKVLEYTRHRNDLFCEFECTCPSESWRNTPIEHLMKEKIKFSGYNDNYFFDVVNREPKIRTCKCGKKYRYQWKREGVEVEEITN